MPEWTRTRPTKPGYYWIRNSNIGHYKIVELYFDSPPMKGMSPILYVRCMGRGGDPMLAEFTHREWQGPIKPNDEGDDTHV